MNKKILFTLSLLSIMVFLSSCGGGGGGGSLSTPPGTNTGVPSVVKLLDVQNIAQTNSTIYMKAKVLDGNGNPVQNVSVTFTNLSAPFGQLSATIANTDTAGVATVTLQSAVPGFLTVLAEINAGAGQVRDRLTLYFTDFNFEVPGQALLPSMTLDVDSIPGDGIYNQSSDFILYESSTDDTVEVRATVFETLGVPVGPDMSVTWAADRPEAVFVSKDEITDGNGQAKAIVQVPPSSIRNIGTHVNIGASAGNGAFNMVTLFLNPLTVNSVVISAVPRTVDSGGTADIQATVTTNLGTPVPDGTMVNFTSTGGSTLETPFAQTTDGVAKTTVKAPSVTADTNITVTATVGGKSGSTTLSVTAGEPDALLVIPAAITIVRDAAIAKTTSFTISGGTTPYITTSNNPLLAYNGTLGNGVWGPNSSSTLIVTIPAGDTPGAVTLTITDAKGLTKTAVITITTPAGGGGGGGGTGQPLGISPASATVTGINNTFSGGDGNPVDDLTFVISNVDGVVNCNSSHPSVINSPGTVFLTTSTFEIDPDEVAATTVVTITCTDSNTGFVAATVVTVNPPPLTITLTPIQVIGRPNTNLTPPPADNNTTDDVSVSVIGGSGPYIVTSDQPTIVPGGPWASATLPFSVTVDPTNVLANTVVAFTATDGDGNTATAVLVVYTENTPLVTSTDKQNVIGLANPDGNTADDITITVAGANNPFIVSWVANNGTDCAIAATPLAPQVINGTSGTVVFDPGANLTGVAKACTVNVTDKNGAVNTLQVNIFP